MNHTVMFQRNNANHKYDNRRTFVLQQSYITYQRKPNQQVEIQLLNMIITSLQNQMNNLSNSNEPPDDDPEPETDII